MHIIGITLWDQNSHIDYTIFIYHCNVSQYFGIPDRYKCDICQKELNLIPQSWIQLNNA